MFTLLDLFRQKRDFQWFLKGVEGKEVFFLSSKDRRIGKTYILNELALTLQALGYRVYVLTPYKEQEYYANKFITTSPNEFLGINGHKTVVLADGARYYMFRELEDYCRVKKIPMVGYVNFEKLEKKSDNEELFKREYECNFTI